MNNENNGVLTLTARQAKDILYGDSEDFIMLTDTISETTRWSVIHDIIIRRKADGATFEGGYSEGATEQQDESPWQYEETAEFYEVVEQQVMVTKYVRKYVPVTATPAAAPIATDY